MHESIHIWIQFLEVVFVHVNLIATKGDLAVVFVHLDGIGADAALAWLEVLEEGVLLVEAEVELAFAAIADFTHDADGAVAGGDVVDFAYLEDFGTIQEGDDIGIVFDTPRLADVADGGFLAFEAFTFGVFAVDLGKGDDGDLGILGVELEGAADLAHALVAVAALVGTGDELDIIDDDAVDLVLHLGLTDLDEEFGKGQGGGVVDVDGELADGMGTRDGLVVLLGTEDALLAPISRDARFAKDHTVGEVVVGHLHTEHEHAFAGMGGMLHDVHGKGGLTRTSHGGDDDEVAGLETACAEVKMLETDQEAVGLELALLFVAQDVDDLVGDGLDALDAFLLVVLDELVLLAHALLHEGLGILLGVLAALKERLGMGFELPQQGEVTHDIGVGIGMGHGLPVGDYIAYYADGIGQSVGI